MPKAFSQGRHQGARKRTPRRASASPVKQSEIDEPVARVEEDARLVEAASSGKQSPHAAYAYLRPAVIAVMALCMLRTWYLWKWLVGLAGAYIILKLQHGGFREIYQTLSSQLAGSDKSKVTPQHQPTTRGDILLSEGSVVVLDERVVNSSYVAYRVSVTLLENSWDLWHKYADFEVLQDELTKQGEHKSWDMPRLRDKTSQAGLGGGRASNQSVEAKRVLLRKFVQAICSSPELAELPAVRKFFGLPPASAKAMARLKVVQQQSGLPRSSAHPAIPSNPMYGLYWRDGGKDGTVQIRGLNYLEDRLKVPAGPSLLELIHFDLFWVEETAYHIAQKGKCQSRMKALENSYLQKGQDPPFVFMLNVQLPGEPLVSFVVWWALMNPDMSEDDPALDLLRQYATLGGYEGFERKPSKPVPEEEQTGLPPGVLPDTCWQPNRFKLIPKIAEGPYAVKRVVGSKPTLLGRKLTQRYFRGPHYIETDVDVGSSVIAQNIVALCRNYGKCLTVQMAITLEGRCKEELPERLVGSLELINLDCDKAESLELDEVEEAEQGQEQDAAVPGSP
ncbi:unnamed protein product [Chrysoparadoxa australica]